MPLNPEIIYEEPAVTDLESKPRSSLYSRSTLDGVSIKLEPIFDEVSFEEKSVPADVPVEEDCSLEHIPTAAPTPTWDDDLDKLIGELALTADTLIEYTDLTEDEYPNVSDERNIPVTNDALYILAAEILSEN